AEALSVSSPLDALPIILPDLATRTGLSLSRQAAASAAQNARRGLLAPTRLTQPTFQTPRCSSHSDEAGSLVVGPVGHREALSKTGVPSMARVTESSRRFLITHGKQDERNKPSLSVLRADRRVKRAGDLRWCPPQSRTRSDSSQ